MWDFWRNGKSSGSSRSGSANNLETQGSPGDGQSQLADAAQAQTPPRAANSAPRQVPRELRNLISKVISFKDLRISLEEDKSSFSGTPTSSAAEDRSHHGEGPLGLANHFGSGSSGSTLMRMTSTKVAVEKNKLVIIMVGLPGRGKTFLCNKLKCYLNWLGHHTAHFNVGQYRRQNKDEVQDAAFFDAKNPAGMAARERAFQLALEDMLNYLASPKGQVAIFDATNSTRERRQKLATALMPRVKFLFIESICNDPKVLEQNYLNKMLYSPDYQGVDMQQVRMWASGSEGSTNSPLDEAAKAVKDFMKRIQKYEEVYEPIQERHYHYIKLTDMVTGSGHIDINRISGYLPGKIVFFLMQVCKSGMTNKRKIWLTRHGESQYNQQALIGGDSDLSINGEAYADRLPEVLLARVPKDEEGFPVPVSVWTSTLRRTIQTAQNLPFAKLRWKALDEIDAGICDGMTYAQIADKYPAEFAARKKDKLRYRYPRGESYLDLVQRLEPVITEMEREGESIAIVAHQAVLRVIFGYLMAKPQEEIPRITIPLHTVIELTPMPDGTMGVEHLPVPIVTAPLSPADSLGAGLTMEQALSLTQSAAAANAACSLSHSGEKRSNNRSDSLFAPLPTTAAGAAASAAAAAAPAGDATSEEAGGHGRDISFGGFAPLPAAEPLNPAPGGRTPSPANETFEDADEEVASCSTLASKQLPNSGLASGLASAYPVSRGSSRKQRELTGQWSLQRRVPGDAGVDSPGAGGGSAGTAQAVQPAAAVPGPAEGTPQATDAPQAAPAGPAAAGVTSGVTAPAQQAVVNAEAEQEGDASLALAPAADADGAAQPVTILQPLPTPFAG